MSTLEKLSLMVEQKNEYIAQKNAENAELAGRLQACDDANKTTKKLLEEEINRHLSNKIKKKWNKFWSVMAVFLTPGHTETTLSKRLGIFFKTMWKWAKSGFKLEDDQVAISRFQICMSCPYLKKETAQCTLCGCMMDKKTKMMGASCPVNKWS